MSLPVMGKDSCSVFPKILEQVNDVVGKYFLFVFFLLVMKVFQLTESLYIKEVDFACCILSNCMVS